MNSIKDTISRIGKSIRQVDTGRIINNHNNTNNHSIRRTDTKTRRRKKKDIEIIHSRDHKEYIPNERLRECKAQYTDFQRKLFQDFLKPLDIPNLKTFNSQKEPYDYETAERKLAKKTSKNPQDILDIFIEDRYQFNSLIKYLLDITPSHLKNLDYNNTLEIQRILTQENSVDSIRHHTFTELPSMPSPLTKQSFEQYIYELTHRTHHYKNSSSLQSGIIPHILLHTHKLTNDEYKDYRSTTTFNYLIKYFGYQKKQSLFARELLLVMNKEGHVPNIDTINLLLSELKNHARSRSTTSTYVLAMKYLRLSEGLGVRVNLQTWNKIYDIINNDYIKEIYLGVVQEHGIPISRNLLLRIIDDFAENVKNTGEIVYFIEHDLGYLDWRMDKLVNGKMIYYMSRYDGVSYNEVDITNEYDLKHWLLGISRNERILKNKAMMMLRGLLNKSFPITELIPIYTLVIDELIIEFPDIRHLQKLNFLIRGLIYEATMELNLPIEIINYQNRNSIPENYKIIARNSHNRLIELQARIEFINQNISKTEKLPWELFTSDGESIKEWENIRDKVKEEGYEYFETFQENSIIPKEEISKIMNHIVKRGSSSRNRERLEKINQGFDDYTMNRMKDRKLI
ncbi:AEP3 ATPase expression protein 3 [Candida maltosa Xu316]